MNVLPAIKVEPYTESFETMNDVGDIVPYSELFRADTRLGDVLQIAVKDYQQSDYFRVISAGCSFGAEIDAVLATLCRNTDITDTAVLGLDVNPVALSAAAAGKYIATTSEASLERIYRNEGLHFADEMQQSGLGVHTPVGEGTPIIDASLLRKEAKVKVQSADLLQSLPTAKLAHVILCNNVLFHHTPENAEQIVSNLTQNLAIGGVLGLGANAAQVGMEGNRGVDYLEWSKSLGSALEAQGIQPVLFARDAPFAFQRQR